MYFTTIKNRKKYLKVEYQNEVGAHCTPKPTAVGQWGSPSHAGVEGRGPGNTIGSLQVFCCTTHRAQLGSL